MIDQLRFPVGKYVKPEVISAPELAHYIAEIETFPARLRSETIHLSDIQLDTPYRDGGWTIRQVVHHCADSHMNSYIRFKLALTEEKPTIKPYWENRWADLADYRLPVEVSIRLLEALHERWVVLLRSMSPQEFSNMFIHPEHGKEFTLDENTGIYAWHCNHHLAHITELKKRMGWK